MSATVVFGSFEWDRAKETENVRKHGLNFHQAALAFIDPHRVIAVDEQHSETEPRYFCIGVVGKRVATVRFTRRKQRIRIHGAGFWRKGRKVYEKENPERP